MVDRFESGMHMMFDGKEGVLVATMRVAKI